MNAIMSIKGDLGVYEVQLSDNRERIEEDLYELTQKATFPADLFPDVSGNIMRSIEIRDDSGLVAFRRMPSAAPLCLHNTRELIITWIFSMDHWTVDKKDILT